MKKAILISLGLLIILSSFVSATVYWSDDFEDGDVNGWDLSQYYGVGSYSISSDTVHSGTYSLNLVTPSNEYISIQNTGPSSPNYGARAGNLSFWFYNGGGGRFMLMRNETTVALSWWNINVYAGGRFTCKLDQTDTGLAPSAGWNQIAIYVNSTIARYYFNGAWYSSCDDALNGNFTKIELSSGNRITNTYYDDFNFEIPSPPGTTPPTISNLNCTSCSIPYGDIVEPYETEDTTPTFRFNTNENAWCAISKYDWNYTQMGASRNCTSEEATTSHICTLTTQDKFTNVGTNYLYISCKDSYGNEGNASDHSKSNSGPIRMEILGASETSGDDAIELGIDTSDIKDIAIKYPEQRLSARDLDNDQFTGIFDWVVANQNNSRKWAFNYVSEGESEINNLFNLSTVLYVLQLQNQTNETITDQVGKLINSTWP